MSYLIILTIILTPTFAWRFDLGPLPTNFLMLWVILVWGIFAANLLLQKEIKAFWHFVETIDKKILIAAALFFLAGLISLFVHGLDKEKIGQFIVLFAQPISLFFIGGYVWHENPNTKEWMLKVLYLFLALAGIYAVIQYFTLIGLPAVYWGNAQEPKRALSFFGHPDFYALFTAPLLAFLLPDLFVRIKTSIRKHLIWIALWGLGLIGLLLSLSRAGWVGLGLVGLIYTLTAGNKTIKWLMGSGAIIAIAIVVIMPNLRYRFITPFYGEKSTSSRIELWRDGLKGINQSPILGLGLDGFSREWTQLNNDPAQNSANFPHNIFLDVWVDLGILGLVSFVYLCALYIYRGFKKLKSPNIFPVAIALFLLTLLTQGQFDNPYFRNDLALVFWIVLSLSL